MKYMLTQDYRVDFTAYAPMHTFKGWTVKGIEAEVEIDFHSLVLNKLHAVAEVAFFTTGNEDRNKAMSDYLVVGRFPKASVEMIECKSFKKVNRGAYRVSVLAVLEFMSIRRQMPIIFYAVPADGEMKIEVALQWSFKGYGLNAPRLLFLKVRDIVDIKGWGQFAQLKQIRGINNSQQSQAIPA